MLVSPFCLLQTLSTSPEETLQIIQTAMPCGFPSPADDYLEGMKSLSELLIKHPGSTYLGKATGDSMIDRGILHGSLLIIDRSMPPLHDSTIVAFVAGERMIKILDLKRRLLRSANKKYQPIPITEDLGVICEGVVTFCVTPQANCAFPC